MVTQRKAQKGCPISSKQMFWTHLCYVVTWSRVHIRWSLLASYAPGNCVDEFDMNTIMNISITSSIVLIMAACSSLLLIQGQGFMNINNQATFSVLTNYVKALSYESVLGWWNRSQIHPISLHDTQLYSFYAASIINYLGLLTSVLTICLC